MTIPAEHLAENQKLQAGAYVDLFEIYLVPTGVIYLKDNETVTWQGKTFDGLAVQLSGIDQSADEQESRPQLLVANPDGLFSSYVDSGALDRAGVIRRRILRTHLDSDQNIAQSRTWIISRVSNLRRDTVTFELRSITDGPTFVIPARKYMPPDFPFVTLQ